MSNIMDKINQLDDNRWLAKEYAQELLDASNKDVFNSKLHKEYKKAWREYLKIDLYFSELLCQYCETNFYQTFGTFE